MTENESNHHQNRHTNPNKGTLCKFGCGIRITFDSNTVSKNGKIIPLNIDGSFHDCPARNQEGGYTAGTSNPENRVHKSNDKYGEGSKHTSDSKSFFDQLLENVEHSNTQLERILVEQDQAKEQLENISQTLKNLMEKVR